MITAIDAENIKSVFDAVRDTITIQYIRGLSVPEWWQYSLILAGLYNLNLNLINYKLKYFL